MVCLGFEPGAAVWKAQTDPLSYGGTPTTFMLRPVRKINLSYDRFHYLMVVPKLLG